MKKKGRPVYGTQRQITRAEREQSGFSTGITIEGQQDGTVILTPGKHGLSSEQVVNGMRKLEKYWAKDTSGMWGKL